MLGRRSDGYHEIESLMQAVDLCDLITLQKSDDTELSCDDSSLPSDESNLALRAALLLKNHYYFPGVRIELRKKIPRGAGLGGGSSDAAFVLRGICTLFDLRPDPGRLMSMAAQLGSDVSFFLGRGQALVSGRGEVVRSVELPTDYVAMIVVPPLDISTADIYNSLKFGLTKTTEPILLKKRITISRLVDLAGRFGNDLEKVTLARYPELSELKRILRENGAILSSMTGSGSGVFGIFARGRPNRADLERQIGSTARTFWSKPVTLQPIGVL